MVRWNSRTSSTQKGGECMDNQTQNPTPAADPAVAAATPVSSDTTGNPVQTETAPVDPMAQAAQIPAMPTAPVGADPTPAADPAVTMPLPEQAAPTDIPSVPTVNPMPSTDAQPVVASVDPMVQPVPEVQASDSQSVTPAVPAINGPVTNEELMEELQRIQDRLDEMDEKL